MRKAVLLMVRAGTTLGWAGERRVTVCLPHNPEKFDVFIVAEGLASEIYRNIGIELRWKTQCHAAELDAPASQAFPNLTTLGMRWVEEAPANTSPLAIAAAFPFQYTGARIVLFTDRMRNILRQSDFVGVAVLGHVLAHEIGHVLLGNDEHADEGIMKAYWSASDKTGMRNRPLRFTNNEADMMRQRFDHQGVVIAAR